MTSLSLNHVTIVEPLVRLTEFFRQLRKGKDRALVLAHYAHPAVTHLGLVTGPATVARLVISVVVFSIQRCAGWPWTHVIQKISKLCPPVAYFDAAPPVMHKPFVIRVVAPCSHGDPADVLRTSGQAMFKPSGVFSAVATAGLLSAVVGVVTKRFDFFAAVTRKQPNSLSVARKVFDAPDGHKPVKAHSGQVNQFHKTHYTPNPAVPLTKRRVAEYKQCIGEAA